MECLIIILIIIIIIICVGAIWYSQCRSWPAAACNSRSWPAAAYNGNKKNNNFEIYPPCWSNNCAITGGYIPILDIKDKRCCEGEYTCLDISEFNNMLRCKL